MDFLLFDKKTPVMLSRHLRDLIQTIGETKNKEQEDEIIKKQIATVKAQISNGLEQQKYPDTLVKLIYFETMGYDTSFAHILPINLCQSSNIYIKKMSYLLAAMLVRPGQGVGVLMPNTILKDLQSDNHFIILIVLTMLRYFLTDELIPQILPLIYQLKKHHISMIRRKCLLLLFNIYMKNSKFIENIKGLVTQGLNDQQSPTMFAAVSILSRLVKQNAQSYKDLTKRIVQIMYGIVDHRYPKQYDYHKIPAPWFQIQILKMFEELGKNDQATSSLLYDVIERTFRRACNFHMHFNKAIIQQSIKTISNIYPHKFLIEQSQDNLFRFFDAGNNNMKYFGIATLSQLVKVNKQIVEKWQYLLLQCMDSEDITLAEKTLSLLAQIANQQNTVIILDRLIKLTQKSNDDFQRRKLIQKAILLIERFSQDRQIFLRRMNQIFYKFQRLISDQTIANYLKVVVEMSEFDDTFPDLIISTYTEIISNFKNMALMKVAAWLIGQFTFKIWKRDQNIQIVDQSVMTLLENANEYLDDSSMSFVLATSIAKLSSITTHKEQVKEYWLRLGKSKNFFLHNTGLELIRMAKYSTALYDSNSLSFQRDASFFKSYAESYSDKPKSYLITKSKSSRKISYDLFELTAEETQTKKHAFQFHPNSRWGAGMGSKRISEKPTPIESELVQKKKQFNLRGPHQQKKTKNVVDQRKLKLAKSIFGVKKK